MKLAVGLPDLHPGRGNPIGAAFYSKGIFYPYLVGSDIGCGMGLWQSELKVRRIKRDRWVKKLGNLDEPWQGDRESFVKEQKLQQWNDALGTIGGGNHFAELQQIEKIYDKNLFDLAGLSKDHLQLMVHSGSRGLGNAILRRHTSRFGATGLEDNSSAAKKYLTDHNRAVHWAESNRKLIAKRFLDALGTQGLRVADINHNTLTPYQDGWLHRKGAAPGDKGIVIIPGSRGSLSYIVKPIGDQIFNACSLAHGAGRKYNRSQCKDRFSERFSVGDLQQTNLGSRVICEDKNLLYEELPEAYKNIDIVIQDLVDFGLIQIIASLKPVISYKTRRSS
jgi:release factor H-coupled RctB family protein